MVCYMALASPGRWRRQRSVNSQPGSWETTHGRIVTSPVVSHRRRQSCGCILFPRSEPEAGRHQERGHPATERSIASQVRKDRQQRADGAERHAEESSRVRSHHPDAVHGESAASRSTGRIIPRLRRIRASRRGRPYEGLADSPDRPPRGRSPASSGRDGRTPVDRRRLFTAAAWEAGIRSGSRRARDARRGLTIERRAEQP